MRLISILFFIGIIMVPLITSQTDSPSPDDDFTLPTLPELRSHLKDLWENYKKGFGIIFKTTADEMHRLRIFKKHVKMIIKHNLEYDLGLHTYRLGITNHTELSGVSCRAAQCPSIATVANIARIPNENEQALTEALGLHGPVAVAMYGSLESFRFHKSGVYLDPKCSARNLDHAVLTVDYGVEFSPIKGRQDYYLIKNSWSSAWCDKGDAKIARNSNNLFGLSTDAVYAVLREEFFQAKPMSDQYHILLS